MRELDLFDPFRNLRRMEDRMRRMLDTGFGEFGETGEREPLVDILDKGSELQVVAELPGVEKKDIGLEVSGQMLCIRAKTGFEAREEKKEQGFFYHERSYQSFFRQIPLPVEVVPENASAEFKNGILTVTLAKMHPDKKPESGHSINIK